MTAAAGPYTVWLASYPKSGNTWARAVLGALTPAEPGTRRAVPRGTPPGPVDINSLAGGPIAACRATIDARLGFASSDLLPEELDALRPGCDAALDAESDGIRLRKIHDLFSDGADPVVPPSATRAAIYLVRDPRDVAVSLAHHAGRSPSSAVTMMADPDAVLAGDQGGGTAQARQRLGTWSRHIRSWTGHGLFPVEVFRYEDLHADPVGEFGRMATAAGVPARRAAVAAAVAAAAFDRLRDQEARSGFRERLRPSARFFRRGAPGCWRDELPARLARRIEAEHGPAMAGLGYPPHG